MALPHVAIKRHFGSIKDPRRSHRRKHGRRKGAKRLAVLHLQVQHLLHRGRPSVSNDRPPAQSARPRAVATAKRLTGGASANQRLVAGFRRTEERGPSHARSR